MGRVHLYERGAELAALRAAGIRARAGAGVLVMVEGAAGNGKSTLLAAAGADAAASGLRVLRARGSDLERGLPFGVIRQLFETVVAAAAPAERADLLAGAAAPAERVLALGSSLRDAPPSAAEGGFAAPRSAGSSARSPRPRSSRPAASCCTSWAGSSSGSAPRRRSRTCRRHWN